MWSPLSQGNSVIHAIEPRVRIVITTLATMTTYVIWDRAAIAAVLGAACGLALLARIPWQGLRQRLVPLNVFVTLLLLTLPWNTTGEPLFTIGGIAYTRHGFDHALALALKANALLLIATALLSTIEVTRFGASMEQLGMPTKLTRLLLFAARYLEIISLEFNTLRRILLVRGFQMRFNRHGLRTLGYLLGMLFVRSFERAERITAAMKCRGFEGHFPLAARAPLRLRDGLFFTAGCAGCAAVLALHFYSRG